jgi:hypothetical protein
MTHDRAHNPSHHSPPAEGSALDPLLQSAWIDHGNVDDEPSCFAIVGSCEHRLRIRGSYPGFRSACITGKWRSMRRKLSCASSDPIFPSRRCVPMYQIFVAFTNHYSFFRFFNPVTP